MDDQKQINYRAYLLRLWRETAVSPWRATLEDPHMSERHGFADISQLIAFIKQLDESLGNNETS